MKKTHFAAFFYAILFTTVELRCQSLSDMFNNMNLIDTCGSILHIAVHHDQKDELVKKTQDGHDIDKKNEKGQTALYVAIRFGNLKLAEILIQNGSNINTKDNDGCTPLHFAQKLKKPELIHLLQTEGAKE